MALVLTVGTNTYVSVADADTFINTYYLSTEALFIWWDSLDAAGQALYLYRSARNISKLPLIGFKTLYTQSMEFPRNDDLVVPPEIIEAQILNAYFLSLPVVDLPSNRNVKSYSIDDLSETFFGSTANQPIGVSNEVQQLLIGWLMGGYEIR